VRVGYEILEEGFKDRDFGDIFRADLLWNQAG